MVVQRVGKVSVWSRMVVVMLMMDVYGLLFDGRILSTQI